MLEVTVTGRLELRFKSIEMVPRDDPNLPFQTARVGFVIVDVVLDGTPVPPKHELVSLVEEVDVPFQSEGADVNHYIRQASGCLLQRLKGMVANAEEHAPVKHT